jgi:hypothetical protein
VGGVLAVSALDLTWPLAALAAPAAAGVPTSGTLSLTDPTFVPGKTALHYQLVTLTNPGPVKGKYTFTLTTAGFQGALYLYQSPFVGMSSPPPNLWASKTTGRPVILTAPLTARYQSTFILVITSTSPTAVGNYNLSIAGPTALTFVAPLARYPLP